MNPATARLCSCAHCGAPPPSDAHHPTYGRGLGQKSDDGTCIPLCHACHMAFHDGSGPFKGWTKAERRVWQEQKVEAYNDEQVF